MDWQLLYWLIPLAFLALVLRKGRPTVAEVHSWFEDGAYRMVLLLNGRKDVLQARLQLPDANPATISLAAQGMLASLDRRVRFTDRTVFIPEGAYGLDHDPRRGPAAA